MDEYDNQHVDKQYDPKNYFKVQIQFIKDSYKHMINLD